MGTTERDGALTPTEIQVLAALAEHGTVRAAAEALFMSHHTAESHLTHIRDKTGLRHLPQLIAWAVSCGLFTPPPADRARQRKIAGFRDAPEARRES
jgi:DNA-binding CsgD family transcriptional regulator